MPDTNLAVGQEEAQLELKEEEKDNAPDLTPELKKKVLLQVEQEYQLAWELSRGEREEALKRLKLYNNQKRDKDKVGDPLLFTVFNTVLSDLYSDRLASVFGGREEGDDETAENLTATAEYDAEVMEKDQLDYEWDWDALFFGRGFVLLNEFDRTEGVMAPVAEIIDPMTMLRDPSATSVNGNQKGKGAMLFGGMEVGLTKSEVEDHPAYFNVNLLHKEKDVIRGLMAEAQSQRTEAQGLQDMNMREEELDENYRYSILRWFTTIQGQKYLVEVGNQRRLLVRFQKIEGGRWPIIDRTAFPTAHDWRGVSIPDLVEDKQRARSVMINLGMESAKADLYPMYLYDKRKIGNPKDLDFAFNKYVPVKGEVNNAVVPIQKSVFHQQVNLILNILDVAAQKAVAAPEVSQGVQPSQDRTLGETQLISAGASARHSLAARIFGWSERRFWRQWYSLYKEHFAEGVSTKIIRLQGPLAAEWRELTRENLITKNDPDVYVESTLFAEEERKRKFQEFSIFAQIAMQDPTVNRRYLLRKMGKILSVKKAEMTLMFPATIDEMRAEDENQKLNNNEMPIGKAVDDDIVHIEIHNKASDTPAKLVHIHWHKLMMLYKKENPQLFPQEQPLNGFNVVNQQGSPSANAGARTAGATGMRSSQSQGAMMGA